MSHYTYEIVGGILIFLSSLVSEAFPKKYRIALWIVFAVLAIGYTAIGIRLDKDAATRAATERTENQKERTESENDRRDMKDEIRGLRTNTGNLISGFTGLVPMIATLSSDLAGLRRSAEEAKEHHDPHVIADLESKAQTAQQHVDNLSHELLAVTMAPQVADQLRSWEGELKAAKQDLSSREWEEQTQFLQQKEQGRADPNKSVNSIMENWHKDVQKTEGEYQEKLRGIITLADFARRELLQRIPQPAQSQEDKRQEQQFTQGMQNPGSFPREEAARYLEDLARRVPPPK
jgi:hypothetical protein